MVRFEGALRAGVAVAIALALAGCAQYEARRADGLPLTAAVEPPSQAALAASPPTPKVKTAKAKDADAKPIAAKPAVAYRPAGAADAAEEASCTDVNACGSVLKAMLADPARAWMKRPASPAVLANGVRLFAYRALREKLACQELAAAVTEVEAAATAFRWGVAGVTAGQADRARSLSAEVVQELQAESARRCGPASKTGMIAQPGQRTSPTGDDVRAMQ